MKDKLIRWLVRHFGSEHNHCKVWNIVCPCRCPYCNCECHKY